MATLNTTKKIKEAIDIPAKGQEVKFTFSAPEAKKVFIAGTFNDWNTQSIPMIKGRDGTWRIKMKLRQGKYEYKYFADGTWVQNVSDAELVPNSFGTYNCVISVD